MKIEHTAYERQAIRALAASHKAPPSIRDEAIAAHRAFIARATSGRPRQPLPYGNPYFEFMREVDCQMPDLLLRHRYRKEILSQVTS